MEDKKVETQEFKEKNWRIGALALAVAMTVTSFSGFSREAQAAEPTEEAGAETLIGKGESVTLGDGTTITLPQGGTVDKDGNVRAKEIKVGEYTGEGDKGFLASAEEGGYVVANQAGSITVPVEGKVAYYGVVRQIRCTSSMQIRCA